MRSALSDREVKIITRYILREHLGPFTFALTALTSLMLLNFISRQFGELVGKGLGWNVIGEFLLLSLPFTVALTIPMSVLVAVLYAFSRLAAENEVTAMKANGVSPLRLVSPALAFGVVMTIGLLAFNDQVLPRANHRLKTLQDDISQTKPTLLLKEQVINAIAEGKFYLKAGKIDQAGGRMREVVIYDLSDPMRRRTIYAKSGQISMAPNRRDLDMSLYDGEMQEVATDKPSQLDRMFYKQDRIRIRDVLNEFKPRDADPNSKGDREMGICEMQKRLWTSEGSYQTARREFDDATKHKANQTTAPVFERVPEPRGIGWAYCTLLGRFFSVKTAEAAELPQQQPQQAQDTSSKKKPASSTMVFEGGKLVSPALPGQAAPVAGAIKQDTGRKTPPPQPAPVVTGAPAVVLGGGAQAQQPAPGAPGALTPEQIAAQAAAEVMRSKAAQAVVSTPAAGGAMFNSMESQAKLRLEMAQRTRDRYQIEIHKKFSLAAACLIFCIVAPPIALRFPRGGVGLVIGVSLAVFAIYYVGLIGGESLANKGLVPPFWAMWGTNVIMTVLGAVLMVRMGRDSGSARGGGFREWLDERRLLREERKAA